MRWIRAGIESGQPIPYGPHRVTLRTLVFGLTIPFPAGSYMLLYNRPIQVLVETGEAPARALPVINFTRAASLAAVLYAALAALILWRIANHD